MQGIILRTVRSSIQTRGKNLFISCIGLGKYESYFCMMIQKPYIIVKIKIKVHCSVVVFQN